MVEFVNDRSEPFAAGITRISVLDQMCQLLNFVVELRLLVFRYMRNTVFIALPFGTPMEQFAGGFDVLLAVTEAEIDGGLCIPYRSFWPFFV